MPLGLAVGLGRASRRSRPGGRRERQRVADAASRSSPRRTTTVRERVLQRRPRSGSTAGRPSRVARSNQRGPLMPMTREGWRPAAPSGVVTGIWQTSSVPKRPSRSVAVPPRRAMSAAICGRTSLQRSPSRGAAKARSSSAPSGPASIDRRDDAGRLVDLELQLEAVGAARAAASRGRPARRRRRSSVVGVERSASRGGPRPSAAVRRRRRRPSSTGSGGLAAELHATPSWRVARRRRRPKPPVEP